MVRTRRFCDNIDWQSRQLTSETACQSLDALRAHGLTILGEQEDGGICNGVIVAPAFAAYVQRWTAQYMSFKDSEMGLHSSYYPMLIAREHPAEVVLLPPSQMHWPSFKAEVLYACMYVYVCVYVCV